MRSNSKPKRGVPCIAACGRVVVAIRSKRKSLGVVVNNEGWLTQVGHSEPVQG